MYLDFVTLYLSPVSYNLISSFISFFYSLDFFMIVKKMGISYIPFELFYFILFMTDTILQNCF